MVNQHTLTKRLDDLEQRYDKFKKDLMFIFFTGIIVTVELISSIFSTNIIFAFILLVSSAIAFGFSISYKIIMIKRIWGNKK